MTDFKKLSVLSVSGFKLTCCLSSLCDKMTAKSRRLNMMVRTHMAKRALEIPVEPPVRYFELAECIFRNPWFCLLREELFWEALPRRRKHMFILGIVWIAFQSPPSIFIPPWNFEVTSAGFDYIYPWAGSVSIRSLGRPQPDSVRGIAIRPSGGAATRLAESVNR